MKSEIPLVVINLTAEPFMLKDDAKRVLSASKSQNVLAQRLKTIAFL